MATWPSCIRFQSNGGGSFDCKSLTMKAHGYSASTGKRPWRRARAGGSRIGQGQSVAIQPIIATTLEVVIGKEKSSFADVFGSISNLYTEAGEERRAAAEFVQKTAEEGGRTAADYGKRAYLYGRTAEMVAASKRKGERVVEELELLQGAVMQADTGRTPADYFRRAELFSKSAEVFGDKLCDEP